MKVTFTKKIKCEKNEAGYLLCVNKMIENLKIKFPNLKLRAEDKTEKIHGFLDLIHSNNAEKENGIIATNHKIKVIMYEKSGIDHNDMKHERAIRYNETFPTEKELKEAI